MTIRLLTLVLTLGLVSAAYAQNRDRLAAPGKVPFGTNYEQAKKILGPGATDTRSGLRNAQGLTCSDCFDAAKGAQFSVFFSNDDRMVRVEISKPVGRAKSLHECLRNENELRPVLIKPYGQPNRRRGSAMAHSSVDVFTFKDGGLIEYMASASFGNCAFRVIFMTKDGQHL